MGALIGFLVVITIGLVIFLDVRSQDAKRDVCRAEHHGEPWTRETPWGSTSAGCKIVKVTRFSEDCLEGESLFVTNCTGVTWHERLGKQTVERSTVNDPRSEDDPK